MGGGIGAMKGHMGPYDTKGSHRELSVRQFVTTWFIELVIGILGMVLFDKICSFQTKF